MLLGLLSNSFNLVDEADEGSEDRVFCDVYGAMGSTLTMSDLPLRGR